MRSRFKHIHFAGEWEPDFHNPDRSLREQCEDYARRARSAGATALQVNFVAEPYGPIHLLHPHEIYDYFTGYGANLDCFVESDYSRGIWPRFMLEVNLNRLRLLAEAADRLGMSALLYLCEPRLQREELFDRYPHWRGPRVDNPAFSITPYYALNTACPDVMVHYRQMLAKVLSVAPNIRDVVLFSQDSGSGFSHVERLYAGPNGGFPGKGESPVGRVIGFCRGLVEEGRKVHPDFQVSLSSSYSDCEKRELLSRAGEGVAVGIFGAMSWTGGLEDQWAWNDCGGGAGLRETGFEASRERRIREFKALCELGRAANPELPALLPAPNEHYVHLKYLPNPWEQLEIMERYESWGIKRLHGRGYVADLDEIPGHVNQLAFRKFTGNPGLSADQAVRRVIGEHLPEALMDSVLEALGRIAYAVRRRANFTLFFERTPMLFPGPLVPDPCALSWEEIQDHWHPVLDTMRKIRGWDWWMPSLSPEDFRMIDELFRETVCVNAGEALELFHACLGDGTLQPGQREFLQQQVSACELFLCLQRSQWNAARMAMHWRNQPGDGLAGASEIVADEVENTRRWLEWLGAAPGKWLRLSPFRGALYCAPDELVAILENRGCIMEKHAADPVGIFHPAGVTARPAYVRDWGCSDPRLCSAEGVIPK